MLQIVTTFKGLETGTKGVYEATVPISISVPSAIAWMMEAFLRSKAEGRTPPKTILEGPTLYPFKFELAGSAAAAYNARLDVARHGLDEEIVMLKAG